MKELFEALAGTGNVFMVIVGAAFVFIGVLLRTLYNYSRGIKSKDKPAQWWAKKLFAFALGCLLMRFLNVFVSVEHVDYLYMVGALFGFFPDVALHYLYAAKKKVRGRV